MESYRWLLRRLEISLGIDIAARDAGVGDPAAGHGAWQDNVKWDSARGNQAEDGNDKEIGLLLW